MNKIKLMYDVITTMKEKKMINGSLAINGKKDEVTFGQFKNEFQRNLETGDIKAKIKAQFDFEGKKMNHETSVEFNMNDKQDRIHPHFHKHMNHTHSHDHDHVGVYRHNFKDKLTMLAMILKLVDEMKIEEQADFTLISLNLNELPEEFTKLAQRKMHHHNQVENHKHPFPMKELFTMEKPSLVMILQLSKNKEIEKITISVEGKQSKEDNVTHKVNFDGEAALTY